MGVLSGIIYTLFCFIGTSWSERITVHTNVGLITGLKVQTSFYHQTGIVHSYRGIPYAEPPTGNRRFMKPVPKMSLPRNFNATEFGPGCPQDLVMMMGWVPGYPYMDEDCLTLNVFVPSKTSHVGNYAVMVWIYGGAYLIGQSKMYSAENLTMVGDVIVVTVNYRLTSLGFLSTKGGRYPGNAGLWDQRLALQWVHENIAHFGGDPNRVTIFGESAGAASAILQALYSPNRGLFHRVIAQSGSPLCPWSIQHEPRKYARRLADKLGCTDIDLDAAVDCLQKFDFMVIVNNSRVGTQDETAFEAEFVPTIDMDFITRDQPELLRNGTDLFLDMDFMAGQVSNEGAIISAISIEPYLIAQRNKTFADGVPKDFFRSFYIPMFLKDKYGKTSQDMENFVMQTYTDWTNVQDQVLTGQQFLEFSGDYFFYMPTIAGVRAHAQKPRRARSFMYEFDVRATFNKAPAWIKGAFHGDELPFVFGFPELMAAHYLGHASDYEKQISEMMMIMWSNFAKSGNPNSPVTVPQSVIWPEYDLDTKQYLYIGGLYNTSAAHHLFGQRTAFWQELAPRLHNLESHQTATIVG